MSDSDEDLMPNSVLKYQHDPAAISATNFNNTNITSYTFRNNMMTSTFNMPHLERQRYGMRGFDQRSMYYRRETSPMSLRSFPDSGVQNFHNSFYTRGMSSQRSVFNGRSGSPVSMRSIDSNASVSAADIALAFKNVKFNKYDLRLIKDAYNKFMKNRIRKRIEKRRNLKLFLKGNRRRSGEDSGEQGSDSSISSDDCRSSRTILHKENIPKTIHRPLKTNDLTQFRTTIKESDMYKDCTENLKQNSLRNMFAINSITHNHTVQEKTEKASITLKERFTKGSSFLLPSQRFNKSKLMNNDMAIRNAIPENTTNKNSSVVSENNRNRETDSEKEEIFSENTVKANSTQDTTVLQRKRVLDAEETNFSDRKRNKTAISPIRENDCSSIKRNNQKNDFDFKKPKMPVRKMSNVKKDEVPERLIAKSRQPLTGNLELDLPNNKSQENSNLGKLDSQNKELVQNITEIEQDCSNQSEVTQNSTDVSMKPSFLKRKLFTQKLDVAESKNISSDNLATNSPQTKIYSSCREKNKVRKLVSSQSCLSRDVLGDDNVLDLIHKIVPPNQMNITSATNKKELSKSNNDKWDVASVISMCNNEEGSDTYTDEEIFKVSQIANKTNNKQVNKETDKPKTVTSKVTEPERTVTETKEVRNSKKLNTECKVVIQKLQPNTKNWKQDATKSTEAQCQNKRTVSNCVKSFWDTDFESDIEDRTATPWTSRYQINQGKDIPKDATNNCTNLTLNKRNTLKGTILTVRSFQNKGINSSMRSDISRVSKRKDPDLYPERKEENNNKTVSKNTKSKQNEEKKTKDSVVPSTKPQKDSKVKSDSSNVNNVKPKPKQTKQIKNNKQEHNNEGNTSRESIRLKQKREKAQNDSNTQVNDTHKKRGRPPKNTIDKNDSINKKNNTTSKKSKENTNKDAKSVKNPTIKNATLNRTRQTPRKCNERKQLLSSADQSSLNISNISTRSLRIRRKNVK